jgi:hypothetical protein
MKLTGRNFQSWDKFEVNIEGLAALVGPSDLGKSAVYRALKAVTRNEFPDGFIKNGTNESVVTLQEDLLEATISRTSKGAPTYLVNGNDYKKLSGSVPEDITSLGFGSIVLGDLELDPIFAGQFDPQFGITLKPTQLNQLLGAFASTEKLESGKKEVNRRITETNSESKVIGGELKEIARDIKDIKEFFERDAVALIATLEQLENKILLKGEHSDQLDQLIENIQESHGIQKVLDGIKIPTFIRLAEIRELLYNLEELNETARTLNTLEDALEGIIPPEIHVDPSVLRALDGLLGVRERLSKLPDLPEYKVPDPTLFLALEEYSNLRGEIIKYSHEIDGLDSDIIDVGAQLDRAKAELNAMTVIECPECGHKWRENGD